MYYSRPNRRWLIVDDDRSARMALRSVLATFRIECQEARDGFEAWQMLQQLPFEGIVTDVDMPRWNGLTLLERIRNSPESQISSLPVLVMSSKSDVELIRNLGRARSTYFLPKPVDIRSLGAFVQLSQVQPIAARS